MLQIGENQKSIFFSIQSYGILKTVKHQILKPIVIRKWPLKKNFNTFKCLAPKNIVLMKTNNNTFSAILCLETYDWFCAEKLQICHEGLGNSNVCSVS